MWSKDTLVYKFNPLLLAKFKFESASPICMSDIRAERRTIKINYAKNLILDGFLLKEICLKIDYKAPKHLGKAFKVETGITIVEYRKKNKIKKTQNDGFRGFGKEANGRLEILIETIKKNPFEITKDIANKLGYTNVSSMYNLYFRRTGNTLGEYIRQEKNKTIS